MVLTLLLLFLARTCATNISKELTVTEELIRGASYRGTNYPECNI